MFVGVACVGGLLVGSLTIACLRSHAQQLASRKLGLGPEAGSATHYAYQVSCNLFCITLNYCIFYDQEHTISFLLLYYSEF